jgi:hypothetical protein
MRKKSQPEIYSLTTGTVKQPFANRMLQPTKYTALWFGWASSEPFTAPQALELLDKHYTLAEKDASVENDTVLLWLEMAAPGLFSDL